MSQPDNLVESARARISHMARALLWYDEQLAHQESFRKVFVTLVGAIAEAAILGAEEGAPHAVRQLHFVAVGKSGKVASLAASMFTSVGVLARFLHPSEALHGDLGSVCEHDTVVCLSNQGGSSEIIHLLPKLRERSCRLFGVTGKLDSPLAREADYVLPLPPVEEGCPLQQAPITSTVATLALCQLLVAASVEKRAFDLASYARNHPGGSIGRRIYVKVSDVMVRGESLPIIGSAETFQSCVSQLTSKAMSVLLVTEGQRLLGIISEADLRIAMEKHGPHVFECCARELMNATPIVLEGDILAVDALKIMKERRRPLNFLPVVDAARNVLGLIRLHDLVAAGISLV